MKKHYTIITSLALGLSTLFGYNNSYNEMQSYHQQPHIASSHPFDDPDSFQQYQLKTQDTHYVLGVAVDGRSIELEDRTTWFIPSSSRSSVATWRKGDPVFITPTTSWFFTGNLRHHIRNLRTQSKISTKMETCPDKNGPYTKFVRVIDRYNRRVVLENHYKATFTFDIHPNDIAAMDDWELNDRVFVATNKEWWYDEPSHSMLLINTETLSQVRARE